VVYTITGTDAANYLAPVNYVVTTGVITQTLLTVTANAATKPYDGLAYNGGNGVTYSGFVNSETSAVLGGALAYSGTSQGAINAGSSYVIQPSGLTSSNYAFSYVNGSLTVSTKALTITANNQGKIYGATVTFAGTEFTTSSLVNADTVTSVTLTSAGAAASATVAGSPYSIVPSAALGSGLGNYNISYVNGSLTVSTKALTITADNRGKIYGATVTFAGTEFTTSGLVNADTVTSVTLTSAGAAASATVAGSPYSIVSSAALGSGLLNYNISYVNGSLTVSTKALTITADNRGKIYGATVTFAGTEFTTSSLVNADTVTSVTLTSAGAAASATVAGSPYSIVPSAALGSGLLNYNISYVDGTLTVNLKALTITADNRGKIYGATVTFAGTEFTTSSLVNADTVTSVTLTSAGAAASATVAGSTYPIVPSAALGSGLLNYNISYVNGSLTVNKSSLWSMSSSASTSTHGHEVTFTATFTDTGATGTVTFKDGETILGSATLSNGTATYTTSTLSAGSHSITAVYDGDANFAGSTSSDVSLKVKAADGVSWFWIGGIMALVTLLGLTAGGLMILRRRRKPNQPAQT
jgi:hypothetical protein